MKVHVIESDLYGGVVKFGYKEYKDVSEVDFVKVEDIKYTSINDGYDTWTEYEMEDGSVITIETSDSEFYLNKDCNACLRVYDVSTPEEEEYSLYEEEDLLGFIVTKHHYGDVLNAVCAKGNDENE